jgi:hypothetical protein
MQNVPGQVIFSSQIIFKNFKNPFFLVLYLEEWLSNHLRIAWEVASWDISGLVIEWDRVLITILGSYKVLMVICTSKNIFHQSDRFACTLICIPYNKVIL